MDGEIDYSKYSLQQLHEAKTDINPQLYPMNFEALQTEIRRRQKALPQLAQPEFVAAAPKTYLAPNRFPNGPKSLFRVRAAALTAVFMLCWLLLRFTPVALLEDVLFAVAIFCPILLYFVQCESCHSTFQRRAGGKRKYMPFDFFGFAISRRCPCCGMERI